MPTFLFFAERANETYKLLAEVESSSVELATDELLDADAKFAKEMPFKVVTVDESQDEAFLSVEVENPDEFVQPRRAVSVGGTRKTRQAAPKRQSRAKAVEVEDEPAPAKTTRRTTAKSKPAASKGNTAKGRTTSKPAASKPRAASKPASKPAASKSKSTSKPAAKPKSGAGKPAIKKRGGMKPNAASAE